MSDKYKSFHFTIGPVQGFVAQSRRTRDLLASSFLLSYLAGVAMARVIEERGRIVFPYVHDGTGAEAVIHDRLLGDVYRVRRGEAPEKKPWVGSLPNRFHAKVPADFHPEECAAAVREAWRRVADSVWNAVMTPDILELGRGTREIWERQVAGWWEIAWVEGEDSDLLDRRKNWRSHIPTVEPGDKCTLASELQELSGWVRAKGEREGQDNFWKAVREWVSKLSGSEHELGENERLSAIGLIKRVYPLVARKAIGWEFPPEARFFPSNSYLAALPWLEKAVNEAPKQALAFAEKARKAKIRENRQGVRFFGERDTYMEIRDFVNLDGHAYFKTGLESLLKRQVPKDLEEAYKKLTDAVDSPSPHYALLIMDGDRLGKLLQSNQVEPQDLSRALSRFTDGLEKRIEELDGVTIYAGGDDVLAMFPMDRAIPAAVALREKYRQAFAEEWGADLAEELKPGISAAVVFAHYLVPLSGVIRHAHHLLDDVAKDQTGRNSIAIGVWKRSGPDLVWSMPWDLFYEPGAPHRTILDRLREQLSGCDERGFSGSFLYKLREQLSGEPLFDDDPAKNQEILTRLIAADYLRATQQKGEEARRKAEEMARTLLAVCLRSFYGDGEELKREQMPLALDGALLARFLMEKGRGQA